MDKDTAPAAGVIFIAGDSVLLMCRPDGTWGFPAGTIEPGETTEVAARREVFEETGYQCDDKLIPIGTFENLAAFVAFVDANFAVTLNDEHSAYEWRDIDALPTPLHREGMTRQMLSAAFNANARDFKDTAKQYDINNWFEVLDNPLSLVGVFDYLGRNIPQERDRGNGMKPFKVLRPAEELSDPECLASLRLTPWVIDHTMLGDGTGGTTTTDEKGVRGVIGEQIRFDEKLGKYGGIRGNIKCFSEVLAGQIAAGKAELSLGYRCIYEYAPGVFDGIPYTYVQRRLRGNHVASIPDGRMGPEVAVMDAAFTFTVDAKEFVAMAKKTPNAKKGNVVALTRSRLVAFAQDAEEKIEKGEDTGGDLAAAVKAIKDALPLLEAVEGLKAVGAAETLEVDTETPTLDADDPDKKDDKPAEGMDAAEVAKIVKREVAAALSGVKPAPVVAHGMDAAELYADMNKRNSLAARLSEFVGTFDHAEMTAQQVAAYGVEKLGLPAVKGAEIVAVESYLHGRTPERKGRVANAMDGKDKPKAWLADQLKAQA